HAFHEFGVVDHDEVEVGAIYLEDNSALCGFHSQYRVHRFFLEYVAVDVAPLYKCGCIVEEVKSHGAVRYDEYGTITIGRQVVRKSFLEFDGSHMTGEFRQLYSIDIFKAG